MPSLAAKPLYYADDISSLTAKAELDPGSQSAPPMRLSKSVSLVLTQAKEYDVNYDEELAYLMYIKYLNIVTAIKRSGDYKKDKLYYDSIIGLNNILTSLDRAEQLRESLKLRYEEKAAEELAARLDRETTIEQEVINGDIGNEFILPDVPQHELDDILDSSSEDEGADSIGSGEGSISISATQLYELLTDENLNCLVIDLREKCDYSESNIKLENMNYVNIQPQYINPKTPLIKSIIGNITDPHVIHLLNNRSQYDNIILIDWDSSIEEGIEKTNPIHILHDALFVWDNQCKLKNEPLVLEGGYKNWLAYYPQYTTNSAVNKNQAEIQTFRTLDQIGYDMSYFEKPKPQEPVQTVSPIAPIKPLAQPVNIAGPPSQHVNITGPPSKNVNITGPPSKHVNPAESHIQPVRPANNMPNINRSVKPAHLYNGGQPQVQPRSSLTSQPGPHTNLQNGVAAVTGAPVQRHTVIHTPNQQPEINYQPDPAKPSKPVIPSVNRALKPGQAPYTENPPRIGNSTSPVQQPVASDIGNRSNQDVERIDEAIRKKFAEYRRETEDEERKRNEFKEQQQLEIDELKRLKEQGARDLADIMRQKKRLQDDTQPQSNSHTPVQPKQPESSGVPEPHISPHGSPVQSRDTKTQLDSQSANTDFVKPADPSTQKPKPEENDKPKPASTVVPNNITRPTAVLPENNPTGPAVRPVNPTGPALRPVNPTEPAVNPTGPALRPVNSTGPDVRPVNPTGPALRPVNATRPVVSPVNSAVPDVRAAHPTVPAGRFEQNVDVVKPEIRDSNSTEKNKQAPAVPLNQLPPGWQRKVDENGQHYYIQHTTGIVSTKPPTIKSSATPNPASIKPATDNSINKQSTTNPPSNVKPSMTRPHSKPTTTPVVHPNNSPTPISRPQTSNIPKPAVRASQNGSINNGHNVQPNIAPNVQPTIPHKVIGGDKPSIKTTTDLPGRFTAKLKDETTFDLDGGIQSRTSVSQRKGGMKRFNSQPDLSKLIDDDTEPIKQNLTIPQINRSVKPPVIADRSTKPTTRPRHDPREFIVDIDRQRLESLRPSYGSTRIGLTGLYNLGNQCYMNAALQCLSHTEELREFLRGNNYADCVNISSSKGSKGVISRELAFLVKILWEGSYQYVQPRDFKRYFGYIHSKFDHMNQMDCQEFVIDLLSTLHEDLNEKGNIKQAAPDTDNMSEERAVQTFNNYTQSTNQSKIFSLFYGLHRNSTRCTNSTCGYTSKSYQNFNSLELAIPDHGRTSLSTCIQKYLEAERVEYTCSKCKRKTDAVRKIDLWSLPNVLVCLLKRFDQFHTSLSKKTNHVSFAHQLSITPCPDSRKDTVQYDLYGVINHTGSLQSGHYTSYCKNGNRWYMFNDESVYPVHDYQIESPAAYILFYQKR